MIISIEDLSRYLVTNETDEVLEAKLQALELLIRKYTNNNFQRRGFRAKADIVSGKFISTTLIPFKAGDTVQISESSLNEGLFTVSEVDGTSFVVNEEIFDETDVLVTKVEYPMDVKMGVINMLKWEFENRSKVGIQSETISRHSVTYFNMDGDNSLMGFPKSLLGFLNPYKKARF